MNTSGKLIYVVELSSYEYREIITALKKTGSPLFESFQDARTIAAERMFKLLSDSGIVHREEQKKEQPIRKMREKTMTQADIDAIVDAIDFSALAATFVSYYGEDD